MASLRKRPEAEATDEPAVAISVETDAAPEPLDDATEALKKQIEGLRQSETVQQQAQAAMRDHIDALGHIHRAALDSGLVDTSPEYFDFMETQLATLKRPTETATNLAHEMAERAAQDRTPEPPPRSPRVGYSAPVSRGVPNSNGKRNPGKITLTPQQVEAARISGISPEEYAKQMLQKEQMVASGEYGEQQR